jgi:hypothetical protein
LKEKIVRKYPFPRLLTALPMPLFPPVTRIVFMAKALATKFGDDSKICMIMMMEAIIVMNGNDDHVLCTFRMLMYRLNQYKNKIVPIYIPISK